MDDAHRTAIRDFMDPPPGPAAVPPPLQDSAAACPLAQQLAALATRLAGPRTDAAPRTTLPRVISDPLSRYV